MSAPQSPVIGRRNLTSIPALSSYPVLDVKSEDPPAFFAVQRGPTCGCSRGRRGPAGGGKALGSWHVNVAQFSTHKMAHFSTIADICPAYQTALRLRNVEPR